MKMSIKDLFLFLLCLTFASCAYSANTANAIIEALGSGSFTGKTINLFLIVGILSIAPAIMIMVTSFVRIVIVLSMLRSAIGTQQSPPNQVIIAISLFLTFFIMHPVFEQSYYDGLQPLMEEKLSDEEAFPLIIDPFKKFMIANTREKDLNMFSAIAKLDEKDSIENVPIHVVIPAFMISEMRRAFEIGFLLFLPFLIIDIVVSSILMAMGMMMMPPMMISMPFKIIFFVVIDGFNVLVGTLIKSFIV